MTVQLQHRMRMVCSFRSLIRSAKKIDDLNERYNGRGGVIVDPPTTCAGVVDLAEYGSSTLSHRNYIYNYLSDGKHEYSAPVLPR